MSTAPRAMTLDDLAAVMKVAGHPSRVRILFLLAGGPRDVTGMRESLGVAGNGLNFHVTWMRTLGLVAGERRGYFREYSLTERGRRLHAAAASVLAGEGGVA